MTSASWKGLAAASCKFLLRLPSPSAAADCAVPALQERRHWCCRRDQPPIQAIVACGRQYVAGKATEGGGRALAGA